MKTKILKTLITLDSMSPKKGTMSVDYAITFTLSGQYKRLPATAQYTQTFRPIVEMFKRLGCKLSLFTELTQNYDVHYHGIMSCPVVVRKGRPSDVKRWIVETSKTLSCIGLMKDVSQITDIDGWSNYICADQTPDHWEEFPFINDYNLNVDLHREAYLEYKKEHDMKYKHI